MARGCIVCGHNTSVNQQLGGYARWAGKSPDDRRAEMIRIRAIGVAKQANIRKNSGNEPETNKPKRPRGRPRKSPVENS